MLHPVRAHGLGILGRAQEAGTAVGAADEEFANTRPAEDPSWMTSYDTAHHRGETGRALWHAARRGQFAGEARDRLQRAVAEYAVSAVRARTRSQIKLATLVMATATPSRPPPPAPTLWDGAGPLRSRRAADDLRQLRRFSAPHVGPHRRRQTPPPHRCRDCRRLTSTGADVLIWQSRDVAGPLVNPQFKPHTVGSPTTADLLPRKPLGG